MRIEDVQAAQRGDLQTRQLTTARERMMVLGEEYAHRAVEIVMVEQLEQPQPPYVHIYEGRIYVAWATKGTQETRFKDDASVVFKAITAEVRSVLAKYTDEEIKKHVNEPIEPPPFKRPTGKMPSPPRVVVIRQDLRDQLAKLVPPGTTSTQLRETLDAYIENAKQIIAALKHMKTDLSLVE